MGRLIDADKFKGKVIASHTGSGVIKLIAIDDVPTAYDLGKAVEQLNICLQRALDTLEYEKLHGSVEDRISEAAKVDAFQEAIEIVKGGGVDA